jgi:hypothetical protein
MSKVYLAAKFGQQGEMREAAFRVSAAGHEVTSHWIHAKEAKDLRDAKAAALLDYGDVARADTLIAFSQERGTPHPGGGRHVEFGIAMALDKRIFVIGPVGEHVFHGWPGIQFFNSVDEAIEAL